MLARTQHTTSFCNRKAVVQRPKQRPHLTGPSNDKEQILGGGRGHEADDGNVDAAEVEGEGGGAVVDHWHAARCAHAVLKTSDGVRGVTGVRRMRGVRAVA